MSLVENMMKKRNNGRIEDSGYYYTLGDKYLAKLVQSVHACTISNGSELQRKIKEFTPQDIQILQKKQKLTKKGQPYSNPKYISGTEPTIKDIASAVKNKEDTFIPELIVDKDEIEAVGLELDKRYIHLDGVWTIGGKVYITEIKEGSAFDTKKSSAEASSLSKVQKVFNNHGMTNAQPLMVLWRLSNISEASVKSDLAKSYIITGRDFCNLVGLNFDQINKSREKDRELNRKFVKEALREYYKHEQ